MKKSPPRLAAGGCVYGLSDGGGYLCKVGGFQCFRKVGGGCFHSGRKRGADSLDMFAGGCFVALHSAGNFPPAFTLCKSRPYLTADGGEGRNGGGESGGGFGGGCFGGFDACGGGGFGCLHLYQVSGFSGVPCFGCAIQYEAAGGFGGGFSCFGGGAACLACFALCHGGGFNDRCGAKGGGNVGGVLHERDGNGGADGLHMLLNGFRVAVHFGGYGFDRIPLRRKCPDTAAGGSERGGGFRKGGAEGGGACLCFCFCFGVKVDNKSGVGGVDIVKGNRGGVGGGADSAARGQMVIDSKIRGAICIKHPKGRGGVGKFGVDGGGGAVVGSCFRKGRGGNGAADIGVGVVCRFKYVKGARFKGGGGCSVSVKDSSKRHSCRAYHVEKVGVEVFAGFGGFADRPLCRRSLSLCRTLRNVPRHCFGCFGKGGGFGGFGGSLGGCKVTAGGSDRFGGGILCGFGGFGGVGFVRFGGYQVRGFRGFKSGAGCFGGGSCFDSGAGVDMGANVGNGGKHTPRGGSLKNERGGGVRFGNAPRFDCGSGYVRGGVGGKGGGGCVSGGGFGRGKVSGGACFAGNVGGFGGVQTGGAILCLDGFPLCGVGAAVCLAGILRGKVGGYLRGSGGGYQVAARRVGSGGGVRHGVCVFHGVSSLPYNFSSIAGGDTVNIIAPPEGVYKWFCKFYNLFIFVEGWRGHPFVFVHSLFTE